ncbi:hypothetical protein MTO96_002525 [Rhipicephalus appendiculatus]
MPKLERHGVVAALVVPSLGSCTLVYLLNVPALDAQAKPLAKPKPCATWLPSKASTPRRSGDDLDGFASVASPLLHSITVTLSKPAAGDDVDASAIALPADS